MIETLDTLAEMLSVHDGWRYETVQVSLGSESKPRSFTVETRRAPDGEVDEIIIRRVYPDQAKSDLLDPTPDNVLVDLFARSPDPLRDLVVAA